MVKKDKKLFLIQRILKEMQGGNADFWQIYKLMYFIDFEHYAKFGKSISGSQYYNWQYGPMPYATDADYAKNNLITLGATQDLWRKISNNSVQINLEKAGLEKVDMFSDTEELLMSEVLDKYKRLSGKELVDLSHNDMPWMITKDKEKIEYEYVKWRDVVPTTVEDITDQVFG